MVVAVEYMLWVWSGENVISIMGVWVACFVMAWARIGGEFFLMRVYSGGMEWA